MPDEGAEILSVHQRKVGKGLKLIKAGQTDFETYREIMSELLLPIAAKGLDDDTLKRLYESKLVYLENLREKCFWELNTNAQTHFTVNDYILILDAIRNTRAHLKSIILLAVTNKLAKRKVS